MVLHSIHFHLSIDFEVHHSREIKSSKQLLRVALDSLEGTMSKDGSEKRILVPSATMTSLVLLFINTLERQKRRRPHQLVLERRDCCPPG